MKNKVFLNLYLLFIIILSGCSKDNYNCKCDDIDLTNVYIDKILINGNDSTRKYDESMINYYQFINYNSSAYITYGPLVPGNKPSTNGRIIGSFDWVDRKCKKIRVSSSNSDYNDRYTIGPFLNVDTRFENNEFSVDYFKSGFVLTNLFEGKE
jgi:hypothetical protein